MQDQSWIELGRVTDVGLGEHYVYSTEIGNIMIINISGEFYGLDDICTHDGGPLSDGPLDAEAGTIACPRHGAKFDVKNGAALTMPATKPTKTHEVKIDGDRVLVRLSDG